MANPEHINLLKQGSSVWNKWFKQNLARGLPDLSEADLSDTDLSGVDLRGVTLKRAILIRANLTGANLSGANLSESFLFRATLRNAILRGTSLNGADVSEADLEATDLSNSYLIGSNLSRSNLNSAQLTEADCRNGDFSGAEVRDSNLRSSNFSGANLGNADLTNANCTQTDFERSNLGRTILKNVMFSNAHFYSTIFGSNDLSEVNGLEKSIHHGPSILNLETIHNSRGKLPDGFLRGCGLSDLQIEIARLAAPGLDPERVAAITEGIRNSYLTGPGYNPCFISFNSKDEGFAARLHGDLQSAGVRCWLAPEDTKAGDKFRNHMEDALRSQGRLLIMFSDHSILSPGIEKIVLTVLAMERKQGGRILIPLRLDEGLGEAEQPWGAEIREGRKVYGFSNQENRQAGLRGLLDELRSMPGR